MKSKLICLLLAVFVLCSCDTVENKDAAAAYTLSKEYLEYECTDGDAYLIPYMQMHNFESREVEESTNETLHQTVVDIAEISENVCKSLSLSSVEAKCQTADYLCVVYEWDTNEGIQVKNEEMRLGITIDLKTGNRVFLTDFLGDDDETYRRIAAYIPECPEFFVPLDETDISELLADMSLSEKEYMGKMVDKDGKYTVSSYLCGIPSFYITETQIVLMRDGFPMNDIILER